ncbi:polysaccharide pyruvyl transferase family protein [Mangrovibacterium lignilyticum]|uniref:polysaccharide pyruvyl transferase family protein n=1 Tax=Mangrovibacterium lignilyticum TaxID=2668052 RepID=UPI0013D7CE67|nr:polysaccharide pyruvyl transferase family protein [Mangrovibacterium lignilyticum]
MKIAILTQPLHTNYGGLLQAFALQETLTKMGHEVLIVNLPFKPQTIFGVLKIIIFQISRYLRGQKVDHLIPLNPTQEQNRIIATHTNRFIHENIAQTEYIHSTKRLDKLGKYNFDAYIVGSDQVWRPRYSPGISAFFLNFLNGDSSSKRLSYAASFGVENWEFNRRQTEQCRKLAQKFNAISVREDSGINLCKEYLGVSATQTLDPTLLLDRIDYATSVKKDNIPDNPNSLMLYVLDQSDEKMEIAKKVKNHLGLADNIVMPEKFNKETSSNIKRCIYPPVSEWIKGFMDAKYVVTDSFHGTVFSIIFNKPFLAIGNKGRGLTRFTSVLKLFGLENRLINTVDELTDNLIDEKINFEKVNTILEKEREKALKFLSNNLS